MMRKALVPLVFVLVFVAGGVWWLLQPPGRHLGWYDLGHGRQVHIWTKGDWAGDPVCIYYEITQDGVVLCPTTFIGVDHGERFEFRTASAEDGRLVCVYEVNRAAEDPNFLIIYDAKQKESCQGLPDENRAGGPTVKLKRQEQYRKLRDLNPEFPKIRFLEK